MNDEKLHREVLQRLTAMEVVMHDNQEDFRRVYKLLYGNSRPGIGERLATLEERTPPSKKETLGLAGTISVAIFLAYEAIGREIGWA